MWIVPGASSTRTSSSSGSPGSKPSRSRSPAQRNTGDTWRASSSTNPAFRARWAHEAPPVQLDPADAERIVLALAGSGDEAVGGHGHREIHFVAGLRAHAALLSVVAIR